MEIVIRSWVLWVLLLCKDAGICHLFECSKKINDRVLSSFVHSNMHYTVITGLLLINYYVILKGPNKSIQIRKDIVL